MQSKKRQLMLGTGAAALSTLLPAGKASAVSVTSTRTLVAAYFGGWCNPMDTSQRGVHGDNPWGVYPTALYPINHRMGLFPERFPLTLQTADNYNQAAQHYMDEEILTASQYGIDVFAMNWFRDEFLNYPVINFKNSPNKDRMSFFLQWSNNSNFSTDPPQDTREYFFEGIRKAALHMSDPSYWKINDKPVFAIYSVTQIDRIIFATRGLPSDYKYASLLEAKLWHDAFLQDCHNIVTNVITGNDNTGGITGTRNAARVKNPALETQPAEISTSGITGTLVPSMHLLVATSDIGNWGQCETVQGMYVYNIRSKWVGNTQVKLTSYADMMSTAQSQYNLYISSMRNFTNGKTTWWPTLMAGFDDSAWQASDALAQHCLPTPEQFAQHCAQVSSTHASNTDTTGGITFICAWNEYGEGSWVSPTSAIYNNRLESLQKYLKNGTPYTA